MRTQKQFREPHRFDEQPPTENEPFLPIASGYSPLHLAQYLQFQTFRHQNHIYITLNHIPIKMKIYETLLNLPMAACTISKNATVCSKPSLQKNNKTKYTFSSLGLLQY
jgi:hypothetical protein